MKKFLLVLTMLSFYQMSTQIFAQCENNSFEFNTWEDAGFLIEDEVGVLPTEQALLPVEWTPVLRPFTLLFSELTGIEDTTLANDYFGIQQEVRDESVGDFAMCLEPTGLLNIADALTINICESAPNSLSFDIRHQGSMTDTLQVIYIQGEGDVLSTAFEGSDPEASGATAFGVGILAGGPEEYTTVTLDIQTFDNAMDDPMVADTAVIWLIALGNADNSAYCIDNFSLMFDVTNTEDIAEESLQIYPNPTADQLTIDTENNGTVRILDANGKLALDKVIQGRSTLSLLDLPAGAYTVRFESEKGIISRPLIKL